MKRNSRKHWQPSQTRPETRADRIARVLDEDRLHLDDVLSPEIEAKKARFEGWLKHTNQVHDDRQAPRVDSDPNFMPRDTDFSLGKLTMQDRRARSELFDIFDRDDRIFGMGHMATVTDITKELVKPDGHSVAVEDGQQAQIAQAANPINDIQEPPLSA